MDKIYPLNLFAFSLVSTVRGLRCKSLTPRVLFSKKDQFSSRETTPLSLPRRKTSLAHRGYSQSCHRFTSQSQCDFFASIVNREKTRKVNRGKKSKLNPGLDSFFLSDRGDRVEIIPPLLLQNKYAGYSYYICKYLNLFFGH